jgi:hypothetical protein
VFEVLHVVYQDCKQKPCILVNVTNCLPAMMGAGEECEELMVCLDPGQLSHPHIIPFPKLKVFMPASIQQKTQFNIQTGVRGSSGVLHATVNAAK